MPYPSVDALQKALGEKIFANRVDVKKAAGRALGTIVELITFYMVKQWGYLPHLTIERGLAEFGNDKITHNVEFGLHHCFARTHRQIKNTDYKLPLTPVKLRRIFELPGDIPVKENTLLTSKRILRNACVVGETDLHLYVTHLDELQPDATLLSMSKLKSHPFAMIECKRVGVEDGGTKGPTSIEKAKQGAYVAKHVSSLQKVRGHDGVMYGVWPLRSGGFDIRDLASERKRLIYDVPSDELEGFILTVGIVSNHGNWFTRENMNKELLVLKDSYDWLLFLTDAGIAEFVYDTILSSDPDMSVVRQSFSLSYASGEAGKNQFTKVRIDYDTDQVLASYFARRQSHIEGSWFNILTPKGLGLDDLKSDLSSLAAKI